MSRRSKLRTVAVIAVAWLCLATGVAYAAFTATTANTSSFGAAATFRTYPSQVLNNGPLFFHKEEEARTNTTGSTAADASTNAQPGTYSGRLDGPSMWWKLDDGTGSTAADQSGANLPGTLSGATWTTNASTATSGHSGGGVVFNGSGDYIATSRAAVPTNASLTVSAWVYLTGANVTRTVAAQSGTFTSAYILKWTTESGSNGHWELLTIGSDANAPSVFSGSRGPTITQPTNVWTHLVAVVDVSGATTRLYVNGADSNTGGGSASGYSSSLWNASGPFQVGRARYASAEVDPWSGTIDDVRVWGRALSASEATNVYAGLNDPPQTVWGFDDITTVTATTTDFSSNGNTGTPTGVAFATPKIDREALTWPGSTTSSVVGSKAVLRTDQSFSVAAWLKPTAHSQTVQAAVSQSGNTAFAYELNYRTDVNNSASTKFAFSMIFADVAAPGFTILQSTTTPTLGTWYHVVGTWNASTNLMSIYVNGTLENTVTLGTSSMWNASGFLTAGRGKYANALADPWYGDLDDIRVYQRVLPAAEVSALAATTQSYALSSAQLTGALQGSEQGLTATKAVAYSGIGGGYNGALFTNPAAFTLECWFRSSGTTGGVLLEFGDVVTTVPATYDRVLYVDSTGRLSFGTYSGGFQVLQSPSSYVDGAWHHVAATLSSTAGMALYVDGGLVASNATYTASQTYNGYWRWAMGNLSGWPNRPLSDSFVGALDEIAVYGRALSAQEVAWDRYANH